LLKPQEPSVTNRVLIAEDDRAIRDSVTRALRMEGYSVSAVTDGPSALVAASDLDLLVLDVMMPGLDGLSVCKALRAHGSTMPILILTARTELSDRVSGLDAGADDYLPKPFALVELLARMRALLRRVAAPEAPVSECDVLVVGDLRVETATRRVWRSGREVVLSRTEFDLLELLVRNEDVVLSHATIYDRIWGYDFGPESKNLTVYVSYLRRKIDCDVPVKLIHTVRGVGYTVRAS
jgi:two-component system response regulator MprA